MRALVASCLMFLSGCIALPIPYESIENSTITGRAIDSYTSQPIEGLIVRLKSRGPSDEPAVTGEDGRFTISPKKENRIWAVYPLLPIDIVGYCTDQVSISDNLIGGGYREVSMEVHSCKWPFGRARNAENLNIIDDIGDIRVSLFPERG